jgi:hypothetical protein
MKGQPEKMSVIKRELHESTLSKDIAIKGELHKSKQSRKSFPKCKSYI